MTDTENLVEVVTPEEVNPGADYQASVVMYVHHINKMLLASRGKRIVLDMFPEENLPPIVVDGVLAAVRASGWRARYKPVGWFTCPKFIIEPPTP